MINKKFLKKVVRLFNTPLNSGYLVWSISTLKMLQH
ncbi:hypothetical protein V461_00415 [Pantoea ananatis BRT98]|nr:hypothetical protein V461_00415 [Pantoea ananatis BRT98]CCF08169.1 hypothetical protein PANA5342_0776 [Pantoea ananatis LMG 5342]